MTRNEATNKNNIDQNMRVTRSTSQENKILAPDISHIVEFAMRLCILITDKPNPKPSSAAKTKEINDRYTESIAKAKKAQR